MKSVHNDTQAPRSTAKLVLIIAGCILLVLIFGAVAVTIRMHYAPELGTYSTENVVYTLELARFPIAGDSDALYVYGTVLEVDTGAEGLLLRPASYMREEYGDVIRVDMHTAPSEGGLSIDDCKRGDQVEVYFRDVKAPEVPGGPLTLIAEQIQRLALMDKPVLYLYPQAPITCAVKVSLRGALTCTYPAHGEDGWQDFVAYPDGTLVLPDGQEYYCLYWEGLSDTSFDLSTGFCVAGGDTAAFLADILPRLGLTPREANEFIIYWLPQMQDNAYNVISFQTTAYTDAAPLEITPAPDSLIRVFMAWYAADAPVNIPPQEIKTPTRDGFVVVEWGGGEVK